MSDSDTVALPKRLSQEQALSLAEVFLEPHLETDQYGSAEYFLTAFLLNNSWRANGPVLLGEVLDALLYFTESGSSVAVLAEREAYFGNLQEAGQQPSARLLAQARNAMRGAKMAVDMLMAANFDSHQTASIVTVHAALSDAVKGAHPRQATLVEMLNRLGKINALPGAGSDEKGDGSSRPGAGSQDGLRAVMLLGGTDFAGGGPIQAFPGGDIKTFIREFLGYTGKQNLEESESVSQPTGQTARTFQLFDPKAAYSALRTRAPASPLEGNATQMALYDRMASENGKRKLCRVPQGDVVQELRTRFPHFGEVLDFVESNLALAACGEEDRPLRIAPFLLKGTPGTGKTFFAQELARLMETSFREVDLSATTEAFVLSGMDSSWKGAKPGLVFDMLVNGQHANPVISLNEVDKVSQTGMHNSPISALYSLLEPSSSRKFADEFAPAVQLDASRVVWVLTANEGAIPEPILSRVEVFDIPKPNDEQSWAIAQSVWNSICEGTLPKGHPFAQALPEDLREPLCKLSPREMRKVLLQAAGKAALQSRVQLLSQDVWQLTQAKKSAPGIGFIR